jgi:ATP-dependent RNA helicase DHX29
MSLTNFTDTPNESPLPTRPSTPRPHDKRNGRTGQKQAQKYSAGKVASPSKKLTVTYDSDIEADELIPNFIDAKTKMLQLERAKGSQSLSADDELRAAKLGAKLRKIEGDVLFDRFAAEQLWKTEKVAVEKDLAMVRQEARDKDSKSSDATEEDNPSGDISEEAERIAAEILAQGNDVDDDEGIGGLFDSLPQNEVDPITGKAQTVVNNSDGSKLVIRDFGKWTGVSPRRILEEACRSRSVKKECLSQITGILR